MTSLIPDHNNTTHLLMQIQYSVTMEQLNHNVIQAGEDNTMDPDSWDNFLQWSILESFLHLIRNN
jgi:hypothetical protein